MNTTIYKNITQTTGGKDRLISDVMNDIKTGEWKPAIDELRATGDKSIKQSLPYFTGSGTFSKRNDKSVKERNNRIIIDFDKQDNVDKLENIEQVRAILSADPYTEYLFLSCSGNGFALMVKIDGMKHKESFSGLQAYYLKKYDLVIDSSCNDLSRARFVSYDPELFENLNSEIFTDIIEEDELDFTAKVQTKPTKTVKNKTAEPASNKYHQKQIVDSAIERFNNCNDGEKHITLRNTAHLLGGYIASGAIDENYTIKRLTQAINQKENIDDKNLALSTMNSGIAKGKEKPIRFEKRRNNKETRELYSKLDKTKSAEEFARVLNKEGKPWSDENIQYCSCNFNLTPAETETIFKDTYEKYEDESGLSNKDKVIQAKHWIRSNHDLIRDEVTHQLLSKEEERLIPTSPEDIWNELVDAEIKISMKGELNNVLESSFVPSFDPLFKYFNSLEDIKDDEPDYIAELASHIHTAQQTLFVEMFRKHLIRSVACGTSDYVNRFVFVLVGEQQNTGKSFFLRNLCPFGTKKYYTEEDLDRGKDTDIALTTNFIYNLDELSSIKKVDINKLKTKVSAMQVTCRLPYAPRAGSHRRRCNFWGSTNSIDFLGDTQNTRWLCFEVERVDFNYSKDVDIRNVWRQAWHLYNSGYPYELSKEEERLRDVANEDFQTLTMEEDLLLKYYKHPEDEKGEFMFTGVIVEEIKRRSGVANLSIETMGKALKRNGFDDGRKRINGKRKRGYFVKEIILMQAVTNNLTRYEN